mgnify:CR=1 FL=1
MICELHGYRRFHQVGQYLFLEGYKVLAHIRVADGGEGKAEDNAFTAGDEEADALGIVFVFTHTA